MKNIKEIWFNNNKIHQNEAKRSIENKILSKGHGLHAVRGILENKKEIVTNSAKKTKKRKFQNFKISTATAVHPNKNTMYQNKSQKAVEAKENETKRQNVKANSPNYQNISSTNPTRGI